MCPLLTNRPVHSCRIKDIYIPAPTLISCKYRSPAALRDATGFRAGQFICLRSSSSAYPAPREVQWDVCSYSSLHPSWQCYLIHVPRADKKRTAFLLVLFRHSQILKEASPLSNSKSHASLPSPLRLLVHCCHLTPLLSRFHGALWKKKHARKDSISRHCRV